MALLDHLLPNAVGFASEQQHPLATASLLSSCCSRPSPPFARAPTCLPSLLYRPPAGAASSVPLPSFVTTRFEMAVRQQLLDGSLRRDGDDDSEAGRAGGGDFYPPPRRSRSRAQHEQHLLSWVVHAPPLTTPSSSSPLDYLHLTVAHKILAVHQERERQHAEESQRVLIHSRNADFPPILQHSQPHSIMPPGLAAIPIVAVQSMIQRQRRVDPTLNLPELGQEEQSDEPRSDGYPHDAHEEKDEEGGTESDQSRSVSPMPYLTKPSSPAERRSSLLSSPTVDAARAGAHSYHYPRQRTSAGALPPSTANIITVSSFSSSGSPPIHDYGAAPPPALPRPHTPVSFTRWSGSGGAEVGRISWEDAVRLQGRRLLFSSENDDNEVSEAPAPGEVAMIVGGAEEEEEEELLFHRGDEQHSSSHNHDNDGGSAFRRPSAAFAFRPYSGGKLLPRDPYPSSSHGAVTPQQWGPRASSSSPSPSSSVVQRVVSRGSHRATTSGGGPSSAVVLTTTAATTAGLPQPLPLGSPSPSRGSCGTGAAVTAGRLGPGAFSSLSSLSLPGSVVAPQVPSLQDSKERSYSRHCLASRFISSSSCSIPVGDDDEQQQRLQQVDGVDTEREEAGAGAAHPSSPSVSAAVFHGWRVQRHQRFTSASSSLPR